MDARAQRNFSATSAPTLFHRDYWSERAIRENFQSFLDAHRSELSGGLLLDYGSAHSPYAAMVTAIGARILPADIEDPGPGGITISPDGRLPLTDGSIDGVISTQVLEHVPDVQAYLREAWRVMRPGALLFLSTHGDWVLHRIPTDFRRWTVDGIQYECEQAGFALQSVTPAVGILASSTHLRTMVICGVLRKVRFLEWLEPLLSLSSNLRMGLENAITPRSVMAHPPQLVFAIARKPV